MYNYIFDADFVCGLPATSLILSAIINCVNKFNSVTRPAYKCLSVSIKWEFGFYGRAFYSQPLHWQALCGAVRLWEP